VVPTLEAIFRRPLRLLLLLIALPLLGAAVAYLLPRSYQATASLWALHRYIVIGATGPESDLLSTPAQTQATALSELLQSRTFALSVAKGTDLPSTYSASIQANPQMLDDTLFTEISTKVLVTPQGYNLFVVTYTNNDPQVAWQVVKTVIDEYAVQSQSFSVVEAQQLLDAYQTQLTKAKQEADAAAAAETQYLQAHPNLTPNDLLSDPQYALLHSQTQQAQATVLNLETAIATVNQEVSDQGSGPDTLFTELDAPQIPVQPVSRLKLFLIAGGAGLGVALLACMLYILMMVRRDHAIYSPLDLKKVTLFPVVLELPHLSREAFPRLGTAETAKAP